MKLKTIFFGILKANNIEIKLTAPEELEAEPETPQPIEASAEEKLESTCSISCSMLDAGFIFLQLRRLIIEKLAL